MYKKTKHWTLGVEVVVVVVVVAEVVVVVVVVKCKWPITQRQGTYLFGRILRRRTFSLVFCEIKKEHY